MYCMSFLDGGKNHGPTLKGSFGAREFLEAKSLIVDEAYIRESIEKPMAKTVKGYRRNDASIQAEEAEYESLVMFIKSVL